MSYFFFSSVVNCLASCGIALLVFFKNRKPAVNRWFIAFAFSTAWWAFGYAAWQLSHEREGALFWIRFAMAGSILIPVLFTEVIVRLVQESAILKKLRQANLCLAIGILAFFYSPYFIDDVAPVWKFPYWPKPGPLFYAFHLFFVANILFSHGLMLQKARQLRGFERKRIAIVFWATFIGFLGGMTNHFMWYGIAVPPYGNIGVSLCVLVLGYGIVVHHLMDIEVIIKKTLVFAGVFGMVMAVISLVTTLTQGVIGRFLNVPVTFSTAISVALAMLLYDPTRKLLVNLTDRFLFQKKYVYYRLLKENSKQMAFIHSLDELARRITAFLIRQGRVKNAAIFVQADDGGRYVLRCPLGYGGRAKRPAMTLDPHHPLIELLRERQGPLQTEEVENRIRQAKDRGGAECEEALRVLKLLKAELAVPSFLRTAAPEESPAAPRPRNILILGPKKSDQPYNEEDLDVFFTLAQDSAIAAENARLFDTVLKEREAKIKAEHVAERVWFAGTIKHEVRNRLAAGIIGPANVLRIHHAPDLKKAFDEGDKEWFQEIFSKIENITKGLLDGAQMILDIADTTLGGLEPDQTKFRRIYFKILWNDAKKASGVEEHCDFESSIPDGYVVYGNYPVLMRVLENLLINAYDAMKDRDEKLVKLRCSYQEIEGKRASYCELEDDGHGISEEIQSKIFERGFSTKPRPEDKDLTASGHGQGLYVCKMNIEKIHGGRIWVESKIGKGTIFKFWIPMGGSNNAEK